MMRLYVNPYKLIECEDGTEITLEEYEEIQNMQAANANIERFSAHQFASIAPLKQAAVKFYYEQLSGHAINIFPQIQDQEEIETIHAAVDAEQAPNIQPDNPVYNVLKSCYYSTYKFLQNGKLQENTVQQMQIIAMKSVFDPASLQSDYGETLKYEQDGLRLESTPDLQVTTLQGNVELYAMIGEVKRPGENPGEIATNDADHTLYSKSLQAAMRQVTFGLHVKWMLQEAESLKNGEQYNPQKPLLGLAFGGYSMVLVQYRKGDSSYSTAIPVFNYDEQNMSQNLLKQVYSWIKTLEVYILRREEIEQN